ncbi:acyl--CoA ligase [Nocardiaceae bacterium YC2-7]|uniref:Acyl--CoA ligase n=1 Tax=Antrihabitans stalactiti TaxID=2584121 RepID=A0A848KM22_9NOCA|nr:acyl--CoA ligase [Antrihabitans stalactiti]
MHKSTVEVITSEGWLRTGDIGRLDDTGHRYVEDRIKDMITTRWRNVRGPERTRPARTSSRARRRDNQWAGQESGRVRQGARQVIVDAPDGPAQRHGGRYSRPHACSPRRLRSSAGRSGRDDPRSEAKILKKHLREPYWDARTPARGLRPPIARSSHSFR